MYIKATSGNSSQLVSAIDKTMTANELRTWELVKSKEGEIYYTHTPGDWNGKAIIGRQANDGNVTFTITHWSNVPKPSLDVEGYYFGRFTEVLLVHFRAYFTRLETGV